MAQGRDSCAPAAERRGLGAVPGAAASAAGGQGRFSPLRQAQQDYFDIERILEWHQFGTYDRFIAHHKQLLTRLNTMMKK